VGTRVWAKYPQFGNRPVDMANLFLTFPPPINPRS